ncbi:hypothetical protein Echvi_3499 [Echinicola vietnamensis DSM 17526]|uniref:Uncharacterized protein n=1 Tax=Echinicola vietnamensis (strain DSM 17526 / LMG 23754 / KMM 6221) TaxID=926556 RepID=L0G4G2_ECHVK|nr:hypothetical protein Echvi_3499 [Echinicola vietnamensis DSM 17526]
MTFLKVKVLLQQFQNIICKRLHQMDVKFLSNENYKNANE